MGAPALSPSRRQPRVHPAAARVGRGVLTAHRAVCSSSRLRVSAVTGGLKRAGHRHTLAKTRDGAGSEPVTAGRRDVLRVEDFFEIGASTDGDAWRLGLAGELDLASGEVLMSEVRRLPISERQSIIVDLSFLEFADVAGIRGLLDAYALLSEHCCDVTLTVANLKTDGAVVLARAGRLVPFAN